MGMDLEGQNLRYFRFGMLGWANVLDLAQSYGWQPRGTVLKIDNLWKGGYSTNDGQTVTEEDARAMAEALRVAVDDEGELWDRHWRAHVVRFVDYCEEGWFRIY